MDYAKSLASMLLNDKEHEKRTAWNNAAPVPGRPELRIDCDYRYILWSEYGRLTEYGWEIDHAHPTALGGPPIGTNLRARHWRGNRRAGGLLGDLLGKVGG